MLSFDIGWLTKIYSIRKIYYYNMKIYKEELMIWYPYVQMKKMKTPYKIIDAQGVYLYTEDNKMIDSVSSWWCMIHGYKNKEISEAMKAQIDKFSHVMLGGLTHEPALKLSEKLKDFLPGDLDYCFFSDSGSVAVEVALKMALQFNINRGSERKKLLSLKSSYHGDTFMCMKAGDDEDYHFILSEDDKKDVIHISTQIDALEKAFNEHGNEFYAFIVEPLLQGAGGMKMYGVDFLKRARQLCDENDVLLIFDEVATGFGRTGNRFVADLVLPDILVLGKALTAGYIGHAVTVANHKVYNGFYSDKDTDALMHGPTFMGNPVACTAALKSIEIFERENYMEKIYHIESVVRKEIQGFEHSLIKDIRYMGGCFCIQVYNQSCLEGFQEFAYKRGVFSRPFLDIMYAMFPYIIRDEEIIQIIDVMKDWFLQK